MKITYLENNIILLEQYSYSHEVDMQIDEAFLKFFDS